jgi:hypothetical protein
MIPGYFPTIPRGAAFANARSGSCLDGSKRRTSARQYQWSIGFQRELNRNLVVDLT